MSARSDAAKLAELGITYWAPGPVTGSYWVLNADGESALVDKNGAAVVPGLFGEGAGTFAQRSAAQRAAELTAAQRHPDCRIAEHDNIPYGLEVPCEIMVTNPTAGRIVDQGAGPDGVHVYKTKPKLIAKPGYSVIPFERTSPVSHYPGGRRTFLSGQIRQRPDTRTYPRLTSMPVVVTR